MKAFGFTIMSCAIMAVGCGGGPCDGDYTGTWIGTTSVDRIDLSDECVFKYANQGCVSSGTYAAPLSDHGEVLVTIESSTGGRCLSLGTHSCEYSASAHVLSFDCGAGTSSYSK